MAWFTCPTSPGMSRAKKRCATTRRVRQWRPWCWPSIPERERISLGIKQLDKDPFSTFIAEHPKGTIVTGKVREVDAKGAMIDLGGGVDGHLRASELSRDRVEDARTLLKVGDEVEAKFTGVDRKSRTIALSIKAKDMHEEAEAMQSYRTDSPSGTSLGDLLKEHIAGQDN